jgi:hypothetical protein
MPSATSRTGRLARNRSLRFSAEKYPGAATARTSASATIAEAIRDSTVGPSEREHYWDLEPPLER